MKSEDAGKPAPGATVVASPCRRRCCLNEAERCLGCGRLLAEILEWGNASDERRRVIRDLAERRLMDG
ncbi:hypothetical protein Pstr01_04650 [Pseudomonas straminea]|uniref:Uncharacterized protein n=1 Tax=Pseudomonas straminea TaxID=47882 RepID=A0A1I1RP66_PSEOC|nr:MULTISPECIES: DUF1289 domain-containing protein [Pseudomonas]TWE07599.1 hypothetical protein FB481_103168 [Pseudomonas sp. AG1028]GLX12226.1 hypothetical protein Pstr01_04650 [Pseudomonas straminea]SFD36129.1 hypothetical protein SAMN05216372_101365 [Pseudomonas straminea]